MPIVAVLVIRYCPLPFYLLPIYHELVIIHSYPPLFYLLSTYHELLLSIYLPIISLLTKKVLLRSGAVRNKEHRKREGLCVPEQQNSCCFRSFWQTIARILESTQTAKLTFPLSSLVI